MRIRSIVCTAALLTVACLATLSPVQAADKDKDKDKDKPYVPATPPALPPHLERGALVCNSREDLMRYQATLVDRTAATGPAPDCHTVVDRIFVNVLGRDGPSRTQVSITGQAGEIAWTNAYLPAN